MAPLVSVCVAALLAISGAGFARQPPPLISTARSLPPNVSRQAAIAALGPATWAVIPKDTGDYRLHGSRELYRLYWAVPGCVPVDIGFDASGRAVGVGAPNLCGADAAGMTALPASRSCAKADRRRLCK